MKLTKRSKSVVCQSEFHAFSLHDGHNGTIMNQSCIQLHVTKPKRYLNLIFIFMNYETLMISMLRYSQAREYNNITFTEQLVLRN